MKLWTGQTISQIGSRVTREGLPMTAVIVLGATPLQMGLLSGAGAATMLIFGLLAGVWADRLRRRPILIASDLGRMAVLAVVPIAAMSHTLTITHLYCVAALTGILTVFFDVAYQAYTPSLVHPEQLADANSKLAVTESLAEIAGPGMTGVLVQWLTAPIAILVDAISFLVSAVSLTFIRRAEPPPTPQSEAHIGHEIAEGLRLCWQNRILRAMAARAGSAAFFFGFFGGLYIIFVMRELGIGPLILGFIVAVGGVSSLAGALLAGRVVRRFGLGRTMIGAAAMNGIASLAIPLAHGPVALCIAILALSQLGDFAWPLYNINEVTLRQSIVAPRLLGRVNSAMLLLFRGAVPLGSIAGGAIAQAIGVRGALFIASSGVILSTLWLVLSPLRRLDAIPLAPSPPAR